MIQANVFVRPGTLISAEPAITHLDGTTSLTVRGILERDVWALSLFGNRKALRAVAEAIVVALDGERPYVAEEL